MSDAPSDTPIVVATHRLGMPWHTADPFLFCVHHDDAYPEGNEDMGPDASLAGRHIGMDFAGKDGWRMYHGDVVPGFPRHPHRGFETITIARRGFIDHSDSLGATARFGHGDVQWMTAGAGIVHSEMFPLRKRDAPNPTELFQIWLNLPRENKMVAPHFTMLWADTIPRHAFSDDAGGTVEVVTVAGPLGDVPCPAPPPDSWASRPDSDIAIWTLSLSPGATWTVPAAPAGVHRILYVFRGSELSVAGSTIEPGIGAELRPDVPVALRCGDQPGEALLLQGRPIGEPVVHYGPFVMNQPREIQQAIVDYQRTQYGGWPWQSDGPVHPRDQERFAVHADGRREEPASR